MKRGYYLTRQKAELLNALSHMNDQFFSVDDFFELLVKSNAKIGKTTVYRFFERLINEGAMLKIPSPDGARNQFQYLGLKQQNDHTGKLICLTCGRTIPLECRHFVAFSEHMQAEHNFKIDQRRNVIYGYCEHCNR